MVPVSHDETSYHTNTQPTPSYTPNTIQITYNPTSNAYYVILMTFMWWSDMTVQHHKITPLNHSRSVTQTMNTYQIRIVMHDNPYLHLGELCHAYMMVILIVMTYFYSIIGMSDSEWYQLVMMKHHIILTHNQHHPIHLTPYK